MQSEFRTVAFSRLQPSSFLACLLGILMGIPAVAADAEYKDHAGLTAELRSLTEKHSNLVRMQRIGASRANRELWLLEVGAGAEGERKQRPGVFVVAGIEGNDLVGGASVVYWARSLVERYGSNDSIRRLLDTTTIYAVPSSNPDARESYFTHPQVERRVNLTPTDEDHDGLSDEDGEEDLNGDGLVSSMRVEDPEGEYILDPKDHRVLIKADKAKGEKGAWKLLREGTDNDKDERWNEDAAGGVNINRNFPYRYEFFGDSTGRHPVSEVESRALADFVVAHPNIGIILTFGATDNLVQTPKPEPGGKRPPQAISEADEPFFKEIGRIYRETLKLDKEMSHIREPGTFSDWMYFHRGRLSLATRPWTPELQIEITKKPAADQKTASKTGGDQPKPDSQDKPAPAPSADPEPKSKPEEKKPPPDKRGEEERAAIKWTEENAPGAFLGWKEFAHPEFPGKKVEIGGWAPFARHNPPGKFLEEITQRHADFLTTLAGKLPRVGVRKTEVKHLGSGVYELRVQVENSGYLPTALAQGALTREVLRTRITLKLEDNQILAGQKSVLLGPIPGSGGMEELIYVVRGTGSLEVEVTSALGGTVRRSVELKEAP